jgi:hypothetical protein
MQKIPDGSRYMSLASGQVITSSSRAPRSVSEFSPPNVTSALGVQNNAFPQTAESRSVIPGHAGLPTPP